MMERCLFYKQAERPSQDLYLVWLMRMGFLKCLEKGRFNWPKTAIVNIDLNPTALTML